MATKYKKRNYEGKLDSIYMYDDADSSVNWSIPIDEANRHYQEYLEWAKTNTIEDADGLTWDDIRNERNKDYQEYLEWSKSNTIDPVDSLTWADIRSTRDGILKSTDWTMTTGATVDQAQWAAYRQVIRDIPQTYKDKTPDDVVWPTQPSTAGPNS